MQKRSRIYPHFFFIKYLEVHGRRTRRRRGEALHRGEPGRVDHHRCRQGPRRALMGRWRELKSKDDCSFELICGGKGESVY